MNLTKYTTKELEFITSNVEFLKKELEKRHIEELNVFPFEVGNVIRTKHDGKNFLLKIKKIDKRNNEVVADEIIIRDNGAYGLFEYYVDECHYLDNPEWHEYTKIEDSEIFENLLNIINKYDNDLQQLNFDTHLKLKNEIAPYDYNV